MYIYIFIFLLDTACLELNGKNIHFPFTIRGKTAEGWCDTYYEYQDPAQPILRKCSNGISFDPAEQECYYSPPILKMDRSQLEFSLDFYYGYVKGNLIINDVSNITKMFAAKTIYVIACWSDKELDFLWRDYCSRPENRYVGEHEYPFKNNTLVVPLNLNSYYNNMTHFTIMVSQNKNGYDLSMGKMFDYYHKVDHCPPEILLDRTYVKYPASYPGTINSICNSFFIPMPNKTMTRTCGVDGHWDENKAACWLGPSDGSGEILDRFVIDISNLTFRWKDEMKNRLILDGVFSVTDILNGSCRFCPDEVTLQYGFATTKCPFNYGDNMRNYKYPLEGNSFVVDPADEQNPFYKNPYIEDPTLNNVFENVFYVQVCIGEEKGSLCSLALSYVNKILGCSSKIYNQIRLPHILFDEKYSYGYCPDIWVYSRGFRPIKECGLDGEFLDLNPDVENCTYDNSLAVEQYSKMYLMENNIIRVLVDYYVTDKHTCNYTVPYTKLEIMDFVRKESDDYYYWYNRYYPEICREDQNKTHIYHRTYNHTFYTWDYWTNNIVRVKLRPDYNGIIWKNDYQIYVNTYYYACQHYVKNRITFNFGNNTEYRTGDCEYFSNVYGTDELPKLLCRNNVWSYLNESIYCKFEEKHFEIEVVDYSASVTEDDLSTLNITLKLIDHDNCAFNYTPNHLSLEYTIDDDNWLNYNHSRIYVVPYCFENGERIVHLYNITANDTKAIDFKVRLWYDNSTMLLANFTKKYWCPFSTFNYVRWDKSPYGSVQGYCQPFFKNSSNAILTRTCSDGGDWIDDYVSGCLELDLPYFTIDFITVEGSWVNETTGHYNMSFSVHIVNTLCRIIPNYGHIRFVYTFLEDDEDEMYSFALPYVNTSICNTKASYSYTIFADVPPSIKSNYTLHAKVCFATKYEICVHPRTEEDVLIRCIGDEQYNATWPSQLVGLKANGTCIEDHVYDGLDEYPSRTCGIRNQWSKPKLPCRPMVTPTFEYDFTHIKTLLESDDRTVSLNGTIYVKDLNLCEKYKPYIFMQWYISSKPGDYGDDIWNISYCFKNNVFTIDYINFEEIDVLYFNSRICIDDICEEVIQTYSQYLFCTADYSYSNIVWPNSVPGNYTLPCGTPSGWLGPEENPTRECYRNGTWEKLQYECYIPLHWCQPGQRDNAIWPLSIPKVAYGRCIENYVSVGPNGRPQRLCNENGNWTTLYFPCYTNDVKYVKISIKYVDSTIENNKFHVNGKIEMIYTNDTCHSNGDYLNIVLNATGKFGVINPSYYELGSVLFQCSLGVIYEADLPDSIYLNPPDNEIEISIHLDDGILDQDSKILGCSQDHYIDSFWNTSHFGISYGTCDEGFMSDGVGGKPSRICNKDGKWSSIVNDTCYKPTYQDLHFNFEYMSKFVDDDSNSFCVSNFIMFDHIGLCPEGEKVFKLELYYRFGNETEDKQYGTQTVDYICEDLIRFYSTDICIYSHSSNNITFTLYADGNPSIHTNVILGCAEIKEGRNNWYSSLIDIQEGYCDEGGYISEGVTGRPIRECYSSGEWGPISYQCILPEYKFYTINVTDSFMKAVEDEFCFVSIDVNYFKEDCNGTLYDYQIYYSLPNTTEREFYNNFTFNCLESRNYHVKPEETICISGTITELTLWLYNDIDYIMNTTVDIGCHIQTLPHAYYNNSIFDQIIEGVCEDTYLSISDNNKPKAKCEKNKLLTIVDNCYSDDFYTSHMDVNDLEISLTHDNKFCINKEIHISIEDKCRDSQAPIKLQLYYETEKDKLIKYSDVDYKCETSEVINNLCFNTSKFNEIKWYLYYKDELLDNKTMILGCKPFKQDRFELPNSLFGYNDSNCYEGYVYKGEEYKPKGICNEDGEYKNVTSKCFIPTYMETKFELKNLTVTLPEEINNTFSVSGMFVTIRNGLCDNVSVELNLSIYYQYQESDDEEVYFFSNFTYHCNEGIISTHKFEDPLLVNGSIYNNITLFLRYEDTLISKSSLVLGCKAIEDNSSIWDNTLLGLEINGTCKEGYEYQTQGIPPCRTCHSNASYGYIENECKKIKIPKKKSIVPLVVGVSLGFFFLLLLLLLLLMYVYKKYRDRQAEKAKKIIIPSDADISFRTLPSSDSITYQPNSSENSKSITPTLFTNPVKMPNKRNIKLKPIQPPNKPVLTYVPKPNAINTFLSTKSGFVVNDNDLTLKINKKEEGGEFEYESSTDNDSNDNNSENGSGSGNDSDSSETPFIPKSLPRAPPKLNPILPRRNPLLNNSTNLTDPTAILGQGVPRNLNPINSFNRLPRQLPKLNSNPLKLNPITTDHSSELKKKQILE